jgi:SRSO17 transposase
LAGLLSTFRDCFRREKTFSYWQTYVAGLICDLKRKSIEPIALAADVPVRTLQEVLADFKWDHRRAEDQLHRLVVDRHGCDEAIGVLDASGHPKQGEHTAGVQRQWCGQTGKVDNCIVGQHLLYTDNHPTNAFSCVLCSDLFLPKSWDEDRERCRRARIPDELVHRPKWRIAVEQLERAIGNGVRFSYVTFDEDYGQVPSLWFELDRLGLRGVGEVRKNFRCWATPPTWQSLRSEYAPKRVENLVTHSPVFQRQKWKKINIKTATRADARWQYKAARVQLPNTPKGKSVPTDRRYWLIVAESKRTGEVKYFVSNAAESVKVRKLLRVGFSRWRIEKWFERGKQEAGFGAFEIRNYTSLIRHWLSSRIAMYFLSSQTQRLRGEKPEDHAGAGRRRDEPAGREDLADVPAILRRSASQLRLLPVA